MTTTIETAWWEDHRNLVTLTRFMAENDFTADEIAYAVEKPHKHGDVWAQAQGKTPRLRSLTVDQFEGKPPGSFEEITCPGCDGSKRVPYEQTSHTVVCGRCLGHGVVYVRRQS